MLLEGEAGARSPSPKCSRCSTARRISRRAARRRRLRHGEIVEQARGPKVYAFKKRRRKNSKRKRGHKQDLTIVRIVEI